MKIKIGSILIFFGLVLLFLLIASSCKQELPPSATGDPVFTLKATFDGTELDRYAGEGDDIMDADLRRDELDVNEFVGTLKAANCMDCPGQFRVVLRDHKASETGDPVDLDSAFMLGAYAYRGNSIAATASEGSAFRFSGFSGGTPPFDYEWEFGDGHTSTDAQPVHVYAQSGDYEVVLKLTDDNGCADVTSHKISTGEKYEDCRVSFDYKALGNGAVDFWVTETWPSNQIVSGLWNFGPGLFAPATLDTGHFLFHFQGPGIYPVSLLAINDEGCLAYDSQNIYTETSPSCASRIEYAVIPKDLETSTVYIEWISEDGTSYTSHDPIRGQPTTSTFILLDAVPYGPDADGQATMKLTLRFDCLLYNLDDPDDFVEVKGGEAVMAVGR